MATHADLIGTLLCGWLLSPVLTLPGDPPSIYLWWPIRSLEGADTTVANSWGGVNAERGALPAAFAVELGQGQLDAYLGHAAGRFPLYLEREQVEALRMPDGQLGPRPGELFETESWTQLSDLVLDHVGRDPGKRLPWNFVSLGDELSFTPWGDPLEFAPTVAMQTRFDRWRSSLGKGPWPLENATWRRALSTGAPRDLEAFVDRRRFEREWFTERVGLLAEGLRAQGIGPLGVLGVYGSPPFGGLAIDALVSGDAEPALDISEPYPEGLARRRVASASGANHRWLTTLFLDTDDPLRDPCIELWSTWAEGCGGFVIWNADRAQPPSIRSTALLTQIQALRTLATNGRWEWRGPHRVALLVDDDQLAFEWLCEARRRPAEGDRRLGGWYEKNGTGTRLRRAWIAALEREGLQPGVLRPEALSKSADFDHLVALEQTWLGTSQAAAVEEYLAAGGHLWVLGVLGALDERGLQRETPLGEHWLAAYPQQVHRLGPLSAGHLNPVDRADLDRAIGRLQTSTPSLSIEPPEGWWLRRGSRSWQGARRSILCLFRAEEAAQPIVSDDLERARAQGWLTLHGPTDGVWLLQGPPEPL